MQHAFTGTSREPRIPWLAMFAAAIVSVAAARDAMAAVYEPDSLGILPPPAHHDSVSPGERVVRAMHDRYAGKWFKTMTLTQTTTQIAADGTPKTSTWYETLSLPGLLRIDVGDPRDGNGVLYTQDSVFRLRGGQLILKAGKTNELLPLTFDVYVVPVERTLATLRGIGFDLGVVHRDSWDGRPVYVVGADSGDLHTPQFWIDKERFVLVRQIEHPNGDTTQVLDAQFDQFQQKGMAWIGTRVQILINGKPVQTEVYNDIKIDAPVSPELFDVMKWTTALHWIRH